MSMRTATLIAFTAVLALASEARAQGTAPAITRTVNRTPHRRPGRTDAQSSGSTRSTWTDSPSFQEPPFTEGTIELDVRGEDVQEQSFVGVAWNVQNDSTYEAVYLRPFNFRTPDTARAKRSLQYVSQPAHPWQKLRAESPGKYEQPRAAVPDPAAWVPLRLVVTPTQVTCSRTAASEADLVVQRLGDVKPGPVALWVGNISRGDFANLRVTPATSPSR